MDEGMPAQGFHSQAISPALSLTAFRALPAAQLQPSCAPTHPSKLQKQLILLSRGRALQCSFLQRLRGKQRGWKEASLGKGPALTHPHMVTTAATQGFYQEPHRGAF